MMPKTWISKAQGGRIGYERGRVVNPGGYAGEFVKFNKITGKKMTAEEVRIEKAFENLVRTKGWSTDEATDEEKTLHAAFMKATGLGRTPPTKISSRDVLRSREMNGELTKDYESDASFEDLETGNITKRRITEGPEGYHETYEKPWGVWEDDEYSPKLFGEKASVDQTGRLRGGLKSGGRIGAQEGGLMDLGGFEKDYRQEGGFVPIGGQEKADDVPARLSKNEFVFTADAVRAAGGGDIDAGAEVMENVMENLEQGGQVSEESQGREGAQNMFATAQRLEGVM